MPPPVSQRIMAINDILAPVVRFFTQSSYARRGREPGACDFALGNPHEMALPGFVAALQRWSVPQDKDWFAYKDNVPEAQGVIASALRQRLGLAFDPADVCVTNGAFAGLSVALTAITDPGDEVIFLSPPWFFYEALIAGAGCRPVRVRVEPPAFDSDLDAIEAAITPLTRAILINSPNNPTGRIYPAAMLEDLARRLTAASQRIGRPIFIFSDEAYSRIVFDGRACPSPSQYYPHTIVIYTYGKTLLTPGQRVGYVAVPPAMPEREPVRMALFAAQVLVGYAFANALLQHALVDLDKLSIDVGHLQRKRDRLVSELRRMGYELAVPEGTFYLLPRSPWDDDWRFVETLAEHNIFALPGCAAEMPGYFRLSLTASDDMIDRALPGFEAARRAATG